MFWCMSPGHSHKESGHQHMKLPFQAAHDLSIHFLRRRVHVSGPTLSFFFLCRFSAWLAALRTKRSSWCLRTQPWSIWGARAMTLSLGPGVCQHFPPTSNPYKYNQTKQKMGKNKAASEGGECIGVRCVPARLKLRRNHHPVIRFYNKHIGVCVDCKTEHGH